MKTLALSLLALGCGGSSVSPPRDIPAADPALTPPEAALSRLTQSQYQNAIRDIFGADVVMPSALEPDVEIAGLFAIGASSSSVSPRGVEQYEVAAYSVAKQAVEQGTSTCEDVDGGCRADIAQLARRAWRRPATEEELETLSGVFDVARQALGGANDGLVYAIAAILQSPSFLYRVELGEVDPDPRRPQGSRRYSGWEVASRLAMLMTNSIPDDALLDAAERGELLTDDGLAREVDRLLETEAARESVRAFFTDLYGLHRLDRLLKDPNVFRHASAEVGPAAREETLRTTIATIFDRDADVGELLTGRRTFVDRRLAAIYDIPAPAREGFGEVEMPPETGRRGLLGQASVLALYAHPVDSSATLRGKFVRQVLLCNEIPPPPANVNTALPTVKPDAKTLKERVRAHLEDPSCAGCHAAMDPIGLGLENFDGLGRWRVTDHGAVIDPSGDLDGMAFANASELAEVVTEHPDFSQCFVRNVLRYAAGEELLLAQEDEVERLTAIFEAEGRRMLPLLREVALSPAFRWAGEAR